MNRIKFLFWALIFVVLAGCGKKDACQEWIQKVNKSNKTFTSTWEYLLLPPGGREESVEAVISLQVEGKKFHLKVKEKRNKQEEWIYDGKTLWKISREDKLIYFSPLKNLPDLPFWRMPVRMRPFGIPFLAGEGELGGRKVVILKIKGVYEKAEVSLTYWIDKTKSVLLKKEHIIGPQEDPLWKETYRIKEVDFVSSFPPATFSLPPLPPGYIKVKKLFIDSQFINSKF
ncbi:MAG: hypothetical protein GXO71_01205 [Caldiserica bacterium]|nr:hypothetical protein [Caldisericota bacterium]